MLAGVLIFILSTTIYENIVVSSKLNKFLDNQILNEEISNDSYKYYYKDNQKSKRKEDYINNKSFCDILVTTASSIRLPLIYNILSTTVGGHAGIVGLKYQDAYYNFSSTDTLDTTSNERSDGVGSYSIYSWENESDFPNYMVLRVELTNDEAIQVYNEVISCLGDPYNLTFLLNTDDSSYCSDLISKAFQKVNINLNYDFGATTVIDLMASKYTEIVEYKVVKNKVAYYYIA